METPVIHNRAVRHEYHILETFEVGVVLMGTEVKSVRSAHLTLSEAFVIVRDNQLFLVNAHIVEYAQGNIWNHKPTRERKLLAHRSEITKIANATLRQGLTIVPLKAFFKGSYLKLEIGIAKGKDSRDKRQDKVKQEAKREIERAIRNANRNVNSNANF